MDEEGLVISSPWPVRGGTSILNTIWPKRWAGWKKKAQWAGCLELEETLQDSWNRAKLCLQACLKMIRVKLPIFTMPQL